MVKAAAFQAALRWFKSSLALSAGVAQLVERIFRKDEATRSMRVIGSVWRIRSVEGRSVVCGVTGVRFSHAPLR